MEFADLSGITRANAFPGIRGQLEITFYDVDRMLEITIESDRSVTVAEDRGREQVYFAEDLSKSNVYQRIREFSQDICPSLDLYIGSTMTQSARIERDLVLQALRSTSAVKSPSRLLIANVQELKAALIAPTLLGIIQDKPGNLLFIGPFETTIFPRAVGSRLRGHPAETIATGTFTIGEGAVPVALLRNSDLKT